jgi:hypothetical protein
MSESRESATAAMQQAILGLTGISPPAGGNGTFFFPKKFTL